MLNLAKSAWSGDVKCYTHKRTDRVNLPCNNSFERTDGHPMYGCEFLPMVAGCVAVQ